MERNISIPVHCSVDVDPYLYVQDPSGHNSHLTLKPSELNLPNNK